MACNAVLKYLPTNQRDGVEETATDAFSRREALARSLLLVMSMTVIHFPLAGIVIGGAIEVHRSLGPGLLESAYQRCLEKELRLRGVAFERQVALPVRYKGETVDCCYRIDLLVEKELVVEIKSVEQLLPVHSAQTITYLKLTGAKQALLLNFNVPALRAGLRSFLA